MYEELEIAGEVGFQIVVKEMKDVHNEKMNTMTMYIKRLRIACYGQSAVHAGGVSAVSQLLL